MDNANASQGAQPSHDDDPDAFSDDELERLERVQRIAGNGKRRMTDGQDVQRRAASDVDEDEAGSVADAAQRADKRARRDVDMQTPLLNRAREDEAPDWQRRALKFGSAMLHRSWTLPHEDAAYAQVMPPLHVCDPRDIAAAWGIASLPRLHVHEQLASGTYSAPLRVTWQSEGRCCRGVMKLLPVNAGEALMVGNSNGSEWSVPSPRKRGKEELVAVTELAILRHLTQCAKQKQTSPCVALLHEAVSSGLAWAAPVANDEELAHAADSAFDAHMDVGVVLEDAGMPLHVWRRQLTGEARTPLAPSTSAHITSVARGIRSGVKWLHTCGIIHGDLKAANVAVDAHGTPRILDFGLAFGLPRSNDATVCVDRLAAVPLQEQPGVVMNIRGMKVEQDISAHACGTSAVASMLYTSNFRAPEAAAMRYEAFHDGTSAQINALEHDDDKFKCARALDVFAYGQICAHLVSPAYAAMTDVDAQSMMAQSFSNVRNVGLLSSQVHRDVSPVSIEASMMMLSVLAGVPAKCELADVLHSVATLTGTLSETVKGLLLGRNPALNVRGLNFAQRQRVLLSAASPVTTNFPLSDEQKEEWLVQMDTDGDTTVGLLRTADNDEFDDSNPSSYVTSDAFKKYNRVRMAYMTELLGDNARQLEDVTRDATLCTSFGPHARMHMWSTTSDTLVSALEQ